MAGYSKSCAFLATPRGIDWVMCCSYTQIWRVHGLGRPCYADLRCGMCVAKHTSIHACVRVRYALPNNLAGCSKSHAFVAPLWGSGAFIFYQIRQGWGTTYSHIMCSATMPMLPMAYHIACTSVRCYRRALVFCTFSRL